MPAFFLFAAHDFDSHRVEIDVFDEVRFFEAAEVEAVEVRCVRSEYGGRGYVERHQRFAKKRRQRVRVGNGGDIDGDGVQYFFAFLRSYPKFHKYILAHFRDKIKILRVGRGGERIKIPKSPENSAFKPRIG